MGNENIDLRDAFFDELYDLARKDKDLIFLTADMGAFSLKRFKKDMREQYINVGVAEQNMISVAAGLALGGKNVFVYSIAPFVTLRCYEQIKIDFCCMNLPVTIVGIGAGVTYGADGPTHHATHDIAVMRALPEMTILNPSDAALTKASACFAYTNATPTYIRIEKGILPSIHTEENFHQGLSELSQGADVTILATGVMVHKALDVAQQMKEKGFSAGVVDIYRIKPLDQGNLLKIITRSKRIVTLEDNSIIGGLGSMISEVICDYQVNKPLKRIAMPDHHCFESCQREDLHTLYHLDVDTVEQTIIDWLSV